LFRQQLTQAADGYISIIKECDRKKQKVVRDLRLTRSSSEENWWLTATWRRERGVIGCTEAARCSVRLIGWFLGKYLQCHWSAHQRRIVHGTARRRLPLVRGRFST